MPSKKGTRQAKENSLSEVLQLFKQQKALQKQFFLEDIKDAWNEELGSGVANYTTDIKFQRNTLYITLSSSTLREELSYGIEKIKVMLNERFDNEPIQKIVLR